MAAGNRVDRQYPANKIKPKLTSEQLAAQMAEFEAANGPVKTSPIEWRGPNRVCARNVCTTPTKINRDSGMRNPYCSQYCSQRDKSERQWDGRTMRSKD